jgi:hypothetical protein
LDEVPESLSFDEIDEDKFFITPFTDDIDESTSDKYADSVGDNITEYMFHESFLHRKIVQKTEKRNPSSDDEDAKYIDIESAKKLNLGIHGVSLGLKFGSLILRIR